jgi:hypothetical protein
LTPPRCLQLYRARSDWTCSQGCDEQPGTYHSDAIFLIGIDAATVLEVFDPAPAGRPRVARGRRHLFGHFEDLLDAARRFEDEPIETMTGRQFTVRVFRDRELVFTPISSGTGQSDGRRAQERFLARYLESRSLRPSDYADTASTAWTRARTIAGSRPRIVPGWLAGSTGTIVTLRTSQPRARRPP